MIIFKIQTFDYPIGANLKSQSPIARNAETPNALSITGQLMGFPRLQFPHGLDIGGKREESDHRLDLRRTARRNARRDTILDQAPQSLVRDASNEHEFGYPE
jgi:hypothetical protein